MTTVTSDIGVKSFSALSILEREKISTKEKLSNTRIMLEDYEKEIKTYHEHSFFLDIPYLEKIFKVLKNDHPDTKDYSTEEKKELHFQLNNLLRYYASLFYDSYHSKVETWKQTTLTSLRFQVCQFEHLAPLLNLVTGRSIEDLLKLKSLEEWPELIKQFPEEWRRMLDCLMVPGNEEKILKEIIAQTPEVRWSFASSLRWSIQCFQNHYEYNLNMSPKMTSFFVRLFNTTKKLLENLKETTKYGEQAKKEIVELEYNSRHVLYLREHNQHDIKGLAKVYFDMFDTLDKSPLFMSRVYNLIGCFFYANGYNDKAYESGAQLIKTSYVFLKPVIEEALAKKSKLNRHEQNVFCGYANYLLRMPDAESLKEVEEILLGGMKFIQEARAIGKDHFNFSWWGYYYIKLLWCKNEKALAQQEMTKLIEYCLLNKEDFNHLLNCLSLYTKNKPELDSIMKKYTDKLK